MGTQSRNLGGINRPLVLASQSPRRAELLRGAGFAFDVQTATFEEVHDPRWTPEALTTHNALGKARVVAQRAPAALVLGADTLVYVDDHPLGKPGSLEEARQMLRRLSGRAHQVCTGVALVWEGGRSEHCFATITDVVFKPLSEEVITAYHSRVDPLDKAGAYGIQEASELILDHMEGSWSNVVGLPVEQLLAELQTLGLR